MGFRGCTGRFYALLVVASLSAPVAGQAATPPGPPPGFPAFGPPGPPRAPRAAAPIDLTGYWVSVITEEWRFRMVTPAKGDFAGVPMTNEAVGVANKWDPKADERAGEQCRSYGAPMIMRVPGRLHITWVDDNTLQMETDAGMQKRLFRFGTTAAPQSAEEPSWQGASAALWQLPAAGGPFLASMGITIPNLNPANGTLKVVTKNLRPGYLRKNGIPYSENTVLTEYFDIITDPEGKPWLALTSIVEDPRYLRRPYILTTEFKKQSDSTGWDPTPCSATW